MTESVAVSSKYNYYRYYDMNKHIYKLNYEERKRKQGFSPKNPNY